MKSRIFELRSKVLVQTLDCTGVGIYSLRLINTFIVRNRGQVPTQPFNNFVRNIEMKSIDKYVLVLVASLALLLAGCGGGSSSNNDNGGDTGEEMQGPTPEQMALSAAQTAADTAATNAETDANMAEGDVTAIIALDGEDHDRVSTARSVANNARAAATRARTASNNAQAAETSAAAVAFQTTAESEEKTAEAFRMSVGDLLTAAQNDEAKRVTDAMTAAITKVAETKEMAIMNEAGQAADAGLGGSDHVNADATDGNEDDPYALNITRDRDGTEIEITDHGNTGDDDPKFTQAGDLGNMRTMHTRDMEADDDGNVVTEVVVVTTDIEAPKAVPFAEFVNAAGNATQPLNADEEGTAATDGAVAYDLGSGALAASVDTQAAILANMMSASFSAPTGSSTVTHTFLPAAEDGGPDTGRNQPREAAAVAGTYNGASGTYTCSGSANCTVTVNSEGELTAATDGWIFTPDEGATSDQPDYEYLHYGFWLKSTADEDGVVTYNEVETFAGSSDTASGDVTSVLGKASYLGGATGVYVHSVLDTNGTRKSATSGHFTANASLTATFGQVPVSDTDTTGTIAPNMLNTLTGTIKDFDLSGGEDSSIWSVELKGDIAPSTGTASGGSMDDGDAWSATFHGSVAEVDSVVPHPHSVVGEFNARFTNGSVAGAFGASKDDD